MLVVRDSSGKEIEVLFGNRKAKKESKKNKRKVLNSMNQYPYQERPSQPQHQQQGYSQQQQPPYDYSQQPASQYDYTQQPQAQYDYGYQQQQPYQPPSMGAQQAGAPTFGAQGATNQMAATGMRLSGRRGLIMGIGGVVAFLGFLLPYNWSYSGYALASMYGIYWLDGLCVVAALVLIGALRVLPAWVQANKKRWAQSLMALGGGGALLHFLIVNTNASPFYWGIGAWLYLLGMIAVGIGALLFA